MATLKNTKITDNGFLKLPTGNNSERPANPSPGAIRWNTEENTIDLFDGEIWQTIFTYPTN